MIRNTRFLGFAAVLLGMFSRVNMANAQEGLKVGDPAPGVEVVGVSGDSVKNHQLFKKAHELNFALLADTNGRVAEAFGVPVTPGEKTVKAVIDGKEEALTRTVTTARWTFVINKSGKIASINKMVKAAEDSKAIIELVNSLSAQ